LRAELQAEGHAVGHYALRTWLHRNGLWVLSTRPPRPRTTVADPAAIVAENRLLGQPAPTAPDQVWVGDSTYLPLVGGRWCYLATWRDTCSRRVVGRHVGPAAHRTRAAGLGTGPSPAAARTGTPHPRRPWQPVHQCRLPRLHRPGGSRAQLQPTRNPYDNAQAEAGWSTLKTELLPSGSPFASLEEARLEVAWYLDTYFNLDCRHSALGYRSPHQFERDLKLNLS